MHISLDHIIPIPLKDVVSQRISAVWNSRLILNSYDRIFIKAPSGTGKTTLIHILYGLRTDYEGVVSWGDKNLRQLSPDALADLRKDKVGIVFQDLRLFPELTALENIEIKRLLTSSITKEQVLIWMDRLQIGHKKDSLALTLSYGEKQRVAIIRALTQPFSWLLMDEPFSHLDSVNLNLAIDLIAEVVKSQSAGMLLADLDDNQYFDYTQTLAL